MLREGERWRMVQGDALETMRGMPDASIDLIATDPPYFKVKGDWWDRQWDTADGFLEWLGRLCEQWRRILKPNGSLYVFASPKMAARVELKVGEWFEVLTRITWRKDAGWANKQCKEEMRAFWPASESIVFAEQFGSDATADGEAGYTTACEATKRSVFGVYLKAEFERAGVTQRQIAALFPSATGGLTGCVSNWLLGYNCPTAEQYQKMREFLEQQGGAYLRRQYEDLRRQYEDLRRPFTVSEEVPYTDVWDFPTVSDYPGKHPCEKPVALMQHIVRASSRPDALVLDCCAGSGTTGVACIRTGRRFLGIDVEAKWVERAKHRIDETPLFKGLDAEPPLFAQTSLLDPRD